MNVIRATLNKKTKSVRGGRGRLRNPPVFNTYYPRNPQDQNSSTSFFSSTSNLSTNQSNTNLGKVLGKANRNDSISHSSETNFRTPKLTDLHPKATSKEQPGKANHNDSTSHSSEANFRTPKSTDLHLKATSKEPEVTNELLAEVFRTPEISAVLNSSSSRLSGPNRQILQRLPPPNSSGRKQLRSGTSSGARPLTTPSHSRTPTTPKTTLSSLESHHHMVVAVTEGRGLARGEVGLAAMDVYRPHLVLCQISDSQTYISTLTKINILQPVEILVPNTFVECQQEGKLFSLLRDNFPQVSITTVQRRHFSDTNGLQQVQALCLPEYANVELIVGQKFYALAAGAALLKFTEYMKNVIFSPKSLKIEYQSPANVMAIDINTAQRLELVMSRSGQDMQNSLMGVLNHCSTASGERSLRANLLQPPTSLELISSRHLSVQELAQNPALLYSLQTAVSKFIDVERLMWLCIQVPNLKNDHRASEIQTNYVLLLKTTLDSLPALRDSLQPSQTPYFHKVLKDLGDERYGFLLSSILEVINEDARVKKGFASSQFQRCFAIKTGINGLLDMARATYSDLIAKMHENVQEMSQEFNLPLKASTTGNKGLHIQMSISKNSGLSAKDLPEVFIQVSRTRNLITCTTEDLVVMNHRMRQILIEIQIMSNSIMQELLHRLREHVGCLYQLCEIVSELDLLVSFSQVSSADKFVQPTFGDEMKLEASRHPILDVISPSTPQPNNVFASAKKNFHIITGPNMGGKSIYIKQVALLQIMAQVGCFVPAESAEFKIIHQIYSRMGFDDSIEYNASSFVYEMQEMQYILRSVGPHSLVLIDELCRSTDYEEGTAVAWVLCEQLLQTNAFTFFTTHYLILTKLQTLYSNVTNHQMVTEEVSEGRLKYTHRLAAGVTKVVLYGLKLAHTSALPLPVLQRAKEICHNLAQNKLAEPIQTEGKTDIEEDEEYIEELLNLVDNNFTVSEVEKVKMKLKRKYGMDLNNENEVASENENCAISLFVDQNKNSLHEIDTNSRESNQDFSSGREPSVLPEKLSEFMEIRDDAMIENPISRTESQNEVQELTHTKSQLFVESHNKTAGKMSDNSLIHTYPFERLTPKTSSLSLQNYFLNSGCKEKSYKDEVHSSTMVQPSNSPEISNDHFSSSNNPDFTQGANSGHIAKTPLTTNHLNLRHFQPPENLPEIPGSSELKQYHRGRESSFNVKNLSVDEFKTPEVMPNKQCYFRNMRNNLSCESLPAFHQTSITEFDSNVSNEFNLGQHFLNTGNSPGYNRQTPCSFNDRFQTLSDVQYSVSRMENRGNSLKSFVSEPWQFQRGEKDYRLAVNNQNRMKRLSSSSSPSVENRFYFSPERAGSSTRLDEDDRRLVDEELLRGTSMQRPSSQSFEPYFHFSPGSTFPPTTPMVLNLQPDLNYLPRNIGSQNTGSLYEDIGEEFMEE